MKLSLDDQITIFTTENAAWHHLESPNGAKNGPHFAKCLFCHRNQFFSGSSQITWSTGYEIEFRWSNNYFHHRECSLAPFCTILESTNGAKMDPLLPNACLATQTSFCGSSQITWSIGYKIEFRLSKKYFYHRECSFAPFRTILESTNGAKIDCLLPICHVHSQR